jgi:hypothetical protein
MVLRARLSARISDTASSGAFRARGLLWSSEVLQDDDGAENGGEGEGVWEDGRRGSWEGETWLRLFVSEAELLMEERVLSRKGGSKIDCDCSVMDAAKVPVSGYNCQCRRYA